MTTGARQPTSAAPRKAVAFPESWFAGRPVWEELATLLSWLREWQLWAALAVGLLVWSLAYAVPYAYELNFGGDRATARRGDDAPFLNIAEKGWNDESEPKGEEWLTSPAPPFRWAFDDARLTLPGLGQGAWRVTILAVGQPTLEPTISLWSDGVYTSTVRLSREPRAYQHVFSTNTRGDLDVRFVTPPYTPPDDPRPLGFVAFSAVVSPVGPQRAPATQLWLLALLLSCCYGSSRRFVLAKPLALAAGIGLAVLAALLLARWRLELTSVMPALVTVALFCYPLGVGVFRLSNRAIPTSNLRGSSFVGRPLSFVLQPSPITALFLLAFALRLGGLLHPQIIFSDIGLNANNLLGLSSGEVFFTEGLPSEAGGGQSPYPPGLYVLAAPGQLLLDVDNTSRLLLLKIVVALLDSVVVWLIWFVLRRREYSEGAALLAAALYLLPTAALRSFGVGEFANIAGQALALPLLVALALHGGRLRQPGVFFVLLALMLVALLGHAGVTISVVLLLGYLGLSWVISSHTRRFVPALLAIGIVAAALLGLFYHSAFLHLFVGAERAAAVAAALPDRGFGAKLVGETLRVFGLPRPTINPLLGVLGAAGLIFIARRPRLADGVPGLWPVLVAWWGSAILSVGLLAVRDQTVRWDLFLYPALCMATGPLLLALWQRNLLGKIAVVAALAIILVHGIVFWGWVIFSQYHD